MKIKVNGEEKFVSENITVGELFQELNISSKGRIVVLNREVVHQNDWNNQKLSPEDDIELLKMVGGG